MSIKIGAEQRKAIYGFLHDELHVTLIDSQQRKLCALLKEYVNVRTEELQKRLNDANTEIQRLAQMNKKK